MDTLVCAEVVCVLSCGVEKWVGESFWPIPEGLCDWGELCNAITNAYVMTLPSVVDANRTYKAKFKGAIRTFKGVFAERMRNHCVEVVEGKRPAVTWMPHGEIRFGFVEVPSNG